MDEVNALSDEAFVARFGGLFEHSPWVAEWVLVKRPFYSVDAMLTFMEKAVVRGGWRRQLQLLRSHPRLADKVAIADGLTKASASEQASAGLDQLTPEEYTRFNELNKAYDEKFGFPFIICVRLAGGKSGILAAMEARLQDTAAGQRTAALNEVFQIARLRLKDLMHL